MTVTLRPDQEQLLLDILRTSSYENAEEAIGSALEILHSQSEWLSANRERELAGHMTGLKAQE